MLTSQDIAHHGELGFAEGFSAHQTRAQNLSGMAMELEPGAALDVSSGKVGFGLLWGCGILSWNISC